MIRFIIKYKFTWYGHPAQLPLSSVTFHCYVYLNTLLARYTKVKYQLKQSFLREY